MKVLVEKSKAFEADKKVATASWEEKLKSMSQQKTTAEQELARVKEALAKSQECLERRDKEQEEVFANGGKDLQEEVAKLREDVSGARRRTEEARKEAEEAKGRCTYDVCPNYGKGVCVTDLGTDKGAGRGSKNSESLAEVICTRHPKVLMNRSKFAESEAMREKGILEAKWRELKEKSAMCTCLGSDARPLKEKTYLSLLEEKPKLLEAIDKKEKELEALKKSKDEMKKNLMKMVTSRNEAYGKKSREFLDEKKVSEERAGLLAEKERQLGEVISRTEATIDGLRRDLEEARRGAAEREKLWSAADEECAKIKVLLNVSRLDEVEAGIRAKDEDIRGLQSTLEKQGLTTKQAEVEISELKTRNRNMVAKLLTNVRSVAETLEKSDNKMSLQKMREAMQILEADPTYENFQAFADQVMADILQILRGRTAASALERRTLKDAESEVARLREQGAKQAESGARLMATVNSVIETFEDDSPPIQDIKRAMLADKCLSSFERRVAHTNELLNEMTRALQDAQDKAEELGKAPAPPPPPPPAEEHQEKIRQLEQSVATSQAELRDQTEQAKELRDAIQ